VADEDAPAVDRDMVAVSLLRDAAAGNLAPRR
jgi:hypothetical protein